MSIRICIAGVTGWTGSEVAKAILQSPQFQLVAAVARKSSRQDVGDVLGLKNIGLTIDDSLEAALARPVDVLIEYTHAESVKKHVLRALDKNIRVVIGSSGLSAADYAEIDSIARQKGIGVIAAGNFSLTAALAKHFSLLAAKYVSSWEIIDYATAKKPDAPSGTTRELAEQLEKVRANEMMIPVDSTIGIKSARGASVAGTQIHSLRLPGYTLAFETIFGLPDERLSIKHDAGTSALPYVGGTLLAAQKVMLTKGLIRGLDNILFDSESHQSID
jgi:4-hydroxy-tetrahydrodipicolinate reductase